MGAMPAKPSCSGPNQPDPFSVNSGFPVASGQKFRGKQDENDGLMVLNRLPLKTHLAAVRFVLVSLCHYIFRLLLPDIRQNLGNY